jgi:hypothetical protein
VKIVPRNQKKPKRRYVTARNGKRFRLVRRRPGSRRIRELVAAAPPMTDEQRAAAVRMLTQL